MLQAKSLSLSLALSQVYSGNSGGVLGSEFEICLLIFQCIFMFALAFGLQIPCAACRGLWCVLCACALCCVLFAVVCCAVDTVLCTLLCDAASCSIFLSCSSCGCCALQCSTVSCWSCDCATLCWCLAGALLSCSVPYCIVLCCSLL